MGSTVAQMGHTLAPRVFNDCYISFLADWQSSLQRRDQTATWLDSLLLGQEQAVHFKAKDDKVEEVAKKVNYALTSLEQYWSSGGWAPSGRSEIGNSET